MNKRGHIVNAVLLSIGLGFILHGSISPQGFITIVKVTPPIVLGALFPDIDTAFGEHRKTFHNVWVLGLAIAFPLTFDNLHYVWIGVLTHYLLDILGNRAGMALFHPLPGYYDIPFGVNVDSRWASIVTLIITGVELAVLTVFVQHGVYSHIASTELPVLSQLLADLTQG